MTQREAFADLKKRVALIRTIPRLDRSVRDQRDVEVFLIALSMMADLSGAFPPGARLHDPEVAQWATEEGL
jgi:hypothetical protein